MIKSDANIKWEMVFENKPSGQSNRDSEVVSLVKESMGAWHKSIKDYSLHTNEDCRFPYIYGERTSCGVFATAIAKYIKDAGSVLTEIPTKKSVSANGGRSDIEWILKNNQTWIVFESKQSRSRNVEGKEHIRKVFFEEKDGLLAQSVRDFGKYQGNKRLSKKSRDDYHHVGLLFCPIKPNSSIDAKDITEIFKPLQGKIPVTLDRNHNTKSSAKDFGKFYSCVYLCKHDDPDAPDLITVAVVFRSPNE